MFGNLPMAVPQARFPASSVIAAAVITLTVE
jgi:hypothetical protein